MKDTFILRTEWYDAISELDNESKANILDNLFYYHSNNQDKIILNNLSVKLVWKLIEPNLQRNINQYDKRRETSIENGKKGGRPKNLSKPKKPIKTKPNQSTTKTKPNEDVYDNVNEDKNDNVDNKTFNVKTDLSYVDDYMLSLWGEWLDYKDEIKKQYKTQRGANTGYTKLIKYSENNIVLATAIIQNSIEHSWDGFFALSEKQREYFLSDNSPYKNKQTSCIDKEEKPYYQ